MGTQLLTGAPSFDVDSAQEGFGTNFEDAKVGFTYDVRCFLDIFDLPTYPNPMLYYISLFSKIRCTLTYPPKNLTSCVNAPKGKNFLRLSHL